MDVHDKAIIHSSNESDYRTPPNCFGRLNDEFRFNLDAAADRESRLTQTWLGPGQFGPVDLIDGLTTPWTEYVKDALGQTIVFLNPPFSKTLVNAYNTGRIKIDGQWIAHEKDPIKAGWYDVANWARKCWEESQKGATTVGIFPFAPQTDWYRRYVYGHEQGSRPDASSPCPIGWGWHAAMQERRLPHRISFLQPDGTPTGNAGVNSVILVWEPNYGIVGPWQPHQLYWSYRDGR